MHTSVFFLDFSLFECVTLKQKHHREKKEKQRIKAVSGINNFYKVMVLLAEAGGCFGLDVMR